MIDSVDETVVIALRPDMTNADARWAATLIVEMKRAKARAEALEETLRLIMAHTDDVVARRHAERALGETPAPLGAIVR